MEDIQKTEDCTLHASWRIVHREACGHLRSRWAACDQEGLSDTASFLLRSSCTAAHGQTKRSTPNDGLWLKTLPAHETGSADAVADYRLAIVLLDLRTRRVRFETIESTGSCLAAT